jgi:hypothetical protein
VTYENSVRTSQETFCGQNPEIHCVKAGGTYSNHWTLKGYISKGGYAEVFSASVHTENLIVKSSDS